MCLNQLGSVERLSVLDIDFIKCYALQQNLRPKYPKPSTDFRQQISFSYILKRIAILPYSFHQSNAGAHSYVFQTHLKNMNITDFAAWCK